LAVTALLGVLPIVSCSTPQKIPVSPVTAQVKPLGFTLGKTTLSEIGKSVPRDKIINIRISNITESAWLYIDPTAFIFDGLEEVILIFDTDYRLAGVILTIEKQRFRDILADLRATYAVYHQDIDEVLQQGAATFRSGDNWIGFVVPRPYFLFTLSYTTDLLHRKIVSNPPKYIFQKRQHERSKL